MNPYCRRANTQAVLLAGRSGEVVVFTMGPPSAEDSLREMLACGATRAVHICDAALSGSDTLATSRTLAAAIQREGPFDLVLAGLNSVDADTGQVGPQIAELLSLPFAAGVRDLDVEGACFKARLETDNGYRWVEGPIPALMTTAERLCDPSKAPVADRSAVPADRIMRLTARDLGLEPHEIGFDGSPTRVGTVSSAVLIRRGYRATDAIDAVDMLESLGAFDTDRTHTMGRVPVTVPGGREVWCLIHSRFGNAERTLLGEAAALAAKVKGSVTAIVHGSEFEGALKFGQYGADQILLVSGNSEPEELVDAMTIAMRYRRPWAVLVAATRDGRAVAAAFAARHQWGLIGDAIRLELGEDDRLVAWKPALGGRLLAPITITSRVQVVTLRPGIAPARLPRSQGFASFERLEAPPAPRVRTLRIEKVDLGLDELLRARTVIGVGLGVDPSDYQLLEPLRVGLGDAPLAATRKVTDRGWMPRSRQVGITGQSIKPQLYVAIGTSGKLNHMIGVQGAHAVLAINADHGAAIFGEADVGLVRDYRTVLPELVEALNDRVSGSGGGRNVSG